jgi:hypothetical protein
MEIPELRQRTLDFIRSEPGYDDIKNEAVSATCSESDDYFILVGGNVQDGIGGFGPTQNAAFTQFVESWKRYKGVEWFVKMR